MYKMAIKITKYREFKKGSLLGFCNILMDNISLEIRDVTYHQKDGKRWVGLPAKPYQDEKGETKYSYIIKFLDKARWGQFQKATLEALDDYLKQVAPGEQSDIPF